jgi:hypothetical protein
LAKVAAAASVFLAKVAAAASVFLAKVAAAASVPMDEVAAAASAFQAEGNSLFAPLRRSRKNAFMSALHSSASTPPSTSTR